MPKRTTVVLDDDLYALLLERAKSPHRFSQTLNELLRAALTEQAHNERLHAHERLNQLEIEIQQLRTLLNPPPVN